MLSQPWWVPLLNSVFEKQFDVVIGFEVTGWVVLGLGIGFHFLNRYEEKAQLADGGKLTREKSRDYRTLRQLLESIHSPTFDEFIDYGVLGFFPRKRTKTARSLAPPRFPERVTFSEQAYNPRLSSLNRQDRAVSHSIRNCRCLSG